MRLARWCGRPTWVGGRAARKSRRGIASTCMSRPATTRRSCGRRWERLRAAEPSVRAAVAAQMTDAHNDYCNPEDEVTALQFADRLRLLSAKFEASGALELVYADGMLFGGHWIIVPIAADGSVGEASEAG
jgi:hypothetical protein